MKDDRKGFNFYRSHWEQIKQLDDTQKLDLFESICKVQFFEEDINNITFDDKITALVWTGFKHSIDTSKSGYIAKNQGLENKKKAEVGDYNKKEFNIIFDYYSKYNNREVGSEEKAKISFVKISKQMKKDDIKKALSNYVKECNYNNTFMKHLCNVLEHDFLKPYLTKKIKKPILRINKIYYQKDAPDGEIPEGYILKPSVDSMGLTESWKLEQKSAIL